MSLTFGWIRVSNVAIKKKRKKADDDDDDDDADDDDDDDGDSDLIRNAFRKLRPHPSTNRPCADS